MSKFGSVLATATAVDQQITARKAALPRKERNPLGADIRIFKDGSVYPSANLAESYNLEFTSRTFDTETNKWSDEVGGNGFDVFDTANYPAIAGARFIAIAAVPRKEGRIDLFASCTYYTPKDAAEGTIPEGFKIGDPVTSVMDQGSKTFGKELLVMLNTVYGVIPNEKGYIDLLIQGQTTPTGEMVPFKNPNGSEVYLVPKTVSRGTKAGELTYERREKINIFALIPHDDSAVGTLDKDDESVVDVIDSPSPVAAMSAEELG